MARPKVLYDACVLYPAWLRDLLLRLAIEGLCRALWSDDILDEVFRNLKAARPDLDAKRLDRTRQLISSAVPDCLVTGHLDLIGDLDLPDLDDRHVLAAAIHGGAQRLVTFNVRDFPSATLAVHGIEVWTPDELAMDFLRVAPQRVLEVVRQQAADLKRPPCTVEILLESHRRHGLGLSVEVIQELLDG